MDLAGVETMNDCELDVGEDMIELLVPGKYELSLRLDEKIDEDETQAIFVRYAPRYGDLARQIKKAVPNADVHGRVGRSRSFEVTLNGKQIFSKLDAGSFPDFDEVVKKVELASLGGEVQEVTEVEKSSCTII
eukprot:Seg2393.2 transcript_id=Seg2393.2/GoldUCD/mRNA.D3Y31 product="Migration and invasion enhancer 1" protein_id=Seg2393.2/GoldUCD/D3Y31